MFKTINIWTKIYIPFIIKIDRLDGHLLVLDFALF